MPATARTLRGGPHNGLKLTLWEPLPPAFRYVEQSYLGVYAPDAVYVLREKQQKNRTIKVYEYTEDWGREVENRRRDDRARRLERIRRQILANPV